MGTVMPPRVAIYARADVAELLRCRCPECLRLDLAHPGEGWQLALFPYRVAIAPTVRR